MKTKIYQVGIIAFRLILGIAAVCLLVIGVAHMVRSQSTPGLGVADDTKQLQQIYASAISGTARISPGADAPGLRRRVANDMESQLEAFLTNYPSSPMNPGVRLKLARRAQLRSSYLSAMDHYAHVWDSLKSSANSSDRQTAAEAAGGLAKLFALTGHLPDLDALEADAKQPTPTMATRGYWERIL